jgi:carbon storage regulator
MLVLSRRVGESLVIGDNVVVTVLEVRGDMIRIGIDAPREVKVHRSEVFQAIEEANKAAASPAAQSIAAFTSALAAKKPAGNKAAGTTPLVPRPSVVRPPAPKPGTPPPGRQAPPPPQLPSKD